MKHFTILELNTDEAPMIGTICNINNDKVGKEIFRESFIQSVADHFDVEAFVSDKIPDLFTGEPYYGIEVTIYDKKISIIILETWII